MKPIRVIVCGGAGFLGYHLTNLLLKHGYDILVVDDLSAGHRENIPEGVKFLYGDISDPKVIKILPEVDYVFHLAALASIQDSINDPIKTYGTNTLGTLNVLDYCRQTGAKLIFSSTSAIYDQRANPPYLEPSPKQPLNPYALQKLHAEDCIRLYAKLYGVKYSILRYSNLFGERSNTEGAYPLVVAIFLKRKAEGMPLQITGDGENRRDFLYAGDAAIANLMAMDWDGIYNIGASYSHSINEIADFVGGEREYVAARDGEVKDNTLDTAKARKAGWKPLVNVKDWISSVV